MFMKCKKVACITKFFRKKSRCFVSVKSMFYSILLGGFEGIFYLCKDLPLKIFLENIWWERKKYLPLQPQTRNKRPSRLRQAVLSEAE